MTCPSCLGLFLNLRAEPFSDLKVEEQTSVQVPDIGMTAEGIDDYSLRWVLESPHPTVVERLWRMPILARSSISGSPKTRFGTLLKPVDFAGAPEASRKTINEWVSREAGQQIKELLPQGTLTPLTRLVLANAITFRATWKDRFNADFTHNSPFYLLDGRQVTVPMMEQITPFPYTKISGVQAVELPYVGDEFSMVILLPAPSQFKTFAKSLTADRVISILGRLSKEMVRVYMPRFEFRSSFELSSTLEVLGMTDAFILGQADFSGMTKSRDLFLEDVHHQSIVSVDENGTFAAAGTAAAMPMPIVPTVRLNRPFIFLIRDIETNTILFIGQVMDPSAG